MVHKSIEAGGASWRNYKSSVLSGNLKAIQDVASLHSNNLCTQHGKESCLIIISPE